MTAPKDWEGILDEGEAIRWQGRPGGRVVWQVQHVFTFLFGLAFAGFAVFWMIMASKAGGGFWMFGLIHFSVGVGLAVGPPFWNAWTRGHTWYTLTDRRAIIATDTPFLGRKLQSYPIAEDTAIEYQPGDPATIHFAHEYRRGKNRSRRVAIGFERIEYGQEVYRMIREIQKGAE
ncbi:MAG: aspartate carbamoyltransferase catalytic subunit [Rhodobacteraceae bacterium]|nr:aspartate carbamoyltransferase catalytic subunit [Paracoccaceae bacterium]